MQHCISLESELCCSAVSILEWGTWESAFLKVTLWSDFNKCIAYVAENRFINK